MKYILVLCTKYEILRLYNASKLTKLKKIIFGAVYEKTTSFKILIH